MIKEKDRYSFLMVFVIFVLAAMAVIPVQAALETGSAGGREKVPYRIPRVDIRARVDGFLDEDIWQKALVLELNYEVDPGENIKPPVRTELLLIHNDTHVYAAFRAYDPNPSAIRARYTDRDNFEGDDCVGLVLDTFSESRRYYRFHCNPFGIQQDLIETLQGSVDDWDGIWDSSGRITREGYIVEMAIPFNILRFQRKSGEQVWRFDAMRCYPRNVVHYIGFFPFDRNNMCYMCQAEELIGFEGIKPGKNIELAPTLSSLLTRERENFTEGKFIKKDGKIDPGITMKWGVTPNMTLNATVNPDFSTVEADVAQLDVNTQFALYYPEKRPFFLEGASYFNTHFPVIYSRALADPNWGIKLIGKEGKNSVGFFSVQDNITNFIFPGSQGSQSTFLEMKTVGTAFRYRRDLGSFSTLGLVVTDREGQDYFNRLAGMDGVIKFTRKDHFIFQFLWSQSRYPDETAAAYGQPADKFTGTALDLFYRHNARNLDWHLEYQQMTPGFRADLGFVPQVNYRNIRGGINHTWLRPPGYWYTWIKAGFSYQYEMDYDSHLIYKAAYSWIEYAGPLQSRLNLTAKFGKKSFMGINFDDNQFFATAAFMPSGTFRMGINGAFGDLIDFTNVQQGKRSQINPVIKFNLGRHLSLLLEHVYERLNVEAGHLYTANVSNLRLVYQFNSRTFLRTIMQYVDYQYNTENYLVPIDPRFKHLFTQILFSYKINPRTVLFLGYSDAYYGFHQVPIIQTSRTLFLKIGYALVL